MSDQKMTAIVDYGMGNLFSVKRACEAVGLAAEITSDPVRLREADGVILPGVGAFGAAMEALTGLHLVAPLKECAATKPFMGICLGLQLLMTKSYEFGEHQGLDIIPGEAVRFDNPHDASLVLKVPQVGWNRIYPAGKSAQFPAGSFLETTKPGHFVYFVHSYYVRPRSPDVILSLSQYGHIEFCSSIQAGHIFACQFHPERSGTRGLDIYRHFAETIQNNKRSSNV